MITCTRVLHFCAGHRVMGHENKCAHLHGHNYKVLVTARRVVTPDLPELGLKGTGHDLDDLGRVVDFSVLKEKLGGWLDQHWDHGFLWHRDDPVLQRLYRELCRGPEEGPKERRGSFKIVMFPCNPTAENLAEYLLRNVAPSVMLGTGVTVTKVRVWETENCYADAVL